ncbi:TerC family protein [Leptospira sp. GIMC2001]|uniref:TerC family protein n=1 Tax=Leptospira sp. GIMC2001 TaxID=1513297 RepID=UPI00234BF476|nr:TerC family protein [Leptospira sp. GIMC2001]WCL49326.1 TerC family protein [Leptospira sp. GIMC2001]
MEIWLLSSTYLALATLTLLEIVLGIDNIIFISILSSKLPPNKQSSARRIGLLLAMGTRVLLLFSLSWVMTLPEPIFEIFSKSISGRDIILIVGGMFLIAKATHEIHVKMEGEVENLNNTVKKKVSYLSVLIQIAILDIVFSLDSVITAVGMADHIAIMIIAVVISVIVMMIFADSISKFVDHHPTIKILALSFLILIGFSLVGEGWELHIPKGYIYFAMTFSLIVEMINIRVVRKAKHS